MNEKLVKQLKEMIENRLYLILNEKAHQHLVSLVMEDVQYSEAFVYGYFSDEDIEASCKKIVEEELVSI